MIFDSFVGEKSNQCVLHNHIFQICDLTSFITNFFGCMLRLCAVLICAIHFASHTEFCF